MSKRLLIIGGSGQLGKALGDDFRAQGWEVLTPGRDELDVTLSENVITEKLAGYKPDVIINTAWFPFVDSEKDLLRAFHVNARGPYFLSKAADAIGATTVQISTDYVFDGLTPEGITESDQPRPVSAHGISKLAGERLTELANARHYIIRTSALFGNHARPLGNFVLRMKARAESAQPTSVVCDQTTIPTYAEDLAPALRMIIEKGLPFGIYHLANSGRTSWHDFAKKIFAKMKKEDLLTPSSNVYEAPGLVRPRHGILLSEKLRSEGFSPLPDWEDAFERYWAVLEERDRNDA